MAPNSLRKNGDFKQVYSHGKPVADSLLVLYTKINGTCTNRLGISVSRKVGKAVTRNKVKRVIKENFRLITPKVKPGYDLVFVARPASGLLTGKAAFHEISRSLVRLLKKKDLL
jgi:ribonuclease P protein component